MQHTKKTRTFILTHPFMGNYGGMLQAYALQEALARLGVEAELVDYEINEPAGLRGLMVQLRSCIRLVQLCTGLTTAQTPIPWCCTRAVARSFRRFACFSPPLQSPAFQAAFSAETDRFIVGSDQVWRPARVRWLRPVADFFLGFAPAEVRRRSIAYAASFATDEWEGTPGETQACQPLLREFRAVSVREESGIRLCRELFGVEAVRMPDPSFLLEAEDYERLIRTEKPAAPASAGVVAYLLDESPALHELLQAWAGSEGLPLRCLMPRVGAPHRRERFPLSVPQWLRGMQEASCVVTDSFHGCVFAILFNKPFICLGNAVRGSARFDSLLRTFGLESRLVETPQQVPEAMRAPIDWAAVNVTRERERLRGLDFLRENLSPPSPPEP